MQFFCCYRQHCSENSYPCFLVHKSERFYMDCILKRNPLLKMYIVQSCKILNNTELFFHVFCGTFYSHQQWKSSLCSIFSINTGYCHNLKFMPIWWVWNRALFSFQFHCSWTSFHVFWWVGFLFVKIGLPRWLSSKESTCNAGATEDRVRSLGQEDPWRRAWQPTPVFLSGEFHGQRSLAGYSPWGCRESDMTEWPTLSLFFAA